MAELRITQLQVTVSFNDKLADKIPKIPIKIKPHLKAILDKKPVKLYTLNFEEINVNFRAKIQQNINEFNDLK